MDLTEFWERYNREAQDGNPEIMIQRAMEEGRVNALYCGAEVSLVAGERDNLSYCQVICQRTEPGMLLGLQAFCFAVTALTGCTKAVRRGWLERMGLFNGKFSTTRARGWELSMRLKDPGEKLASYIIKREKAPDIPRRGVTDERLCDSAGGVSGA